MITCYGYFRSSAAFRCRIAFNLKGVSYDFVPVHLRHGEQHKPGFRTLNPQGLVPAMTHGDLVLTQSLAIIEWLEETQAGPRLLPEDPDLRARVRAFAQNIACDIHPLQNLRVLNYLKTELGHEQAAADDWCRRWIGDGLTACEEILEREPDRGRFCFGDEPGLADICLIPQVFSAERFGVDLSAMPRIREVNAACGSLPAFQHAHPAQQPDYDL